MTVSLRIAPDGARALAALLSGAHRALLSPALAAVIDAEVIDEPIGALATVYARRRQHAPSPTIDGRAPAARLLRRAHRRWRVSQSTDLAARFPTAMLERAGRRALRRGPGWPGAEALAIGVWHAFWAIDDARDRRDLLALLSPGDARQVARAPMAPADAARIWR